MDGDLLDYINAYPRVSFAEKLDFATQITTGVEYLHNVAKVLHRDLKSENVLISKGKLKIADFGLPPLTLRNFDKLESYPRSGGEARRSIKKSK